MPAGYSARKVHEEAGIELWLRMDGGTYTLESRGGAARTIVKEIDLSPAALDALVDVLPRFKKDLA